MLTGRDCFFNVVQVETKQSYVSNLNTLSILMMIEDYI